MADSRQFDYDDYAHKRITNHGIKNIVNSEHVEIDHCIGELLSIDAGFSMFL